MKIRVREILFVFVLNFFIAGVSDGATPGLPFTEDFSDTGMMDSAGTDAKWSTEEKKVYMAWRRRTNSYAFHPASVTDLITGVSFGTRAIALGDVDGDGDLDVVTGNAGGQLNGLYLNNGTTVPFSGSSITADEHSTYAIALGDVDGDGDLDVVAGNGTAEANRLYLNNGTADPFSGVTGSDITADAYNTRAIVLEDVDGDGDLDVVAGNSGQANRLYLNNGTADPFSGVTGLDITTDSYYTNAIALGDMDGDGNLDVVEGNYNQANRLYLNNGTADPFNGVSGSDISADTHSTYAVALGDVDGDNDLDVVAGNNGQTNRLYLNNGTADPFNGVSGSDISNDTYSTNAVALGDVDGDGNLDVVAGNNFQANRLYLNNGTADPFSGVTDSDITADADNTHAIALGDVDGDGDLDVVTGNWNEVNRLYLNNGTADPFNGVSGSDITADADPTADIALGDVDGDGDLDVVVGNNGSPYPYVANRLYLNNGTADPFSGVSGLDITADADDTADIALGDVDSDGDLDVVAGNRNVANRLYLNNGTADPFSGVTGSDITADPDDTRAVALGDMDGDGDLDVVAGNNGQTNRLYLNNGTADPFNGVSGSDISADTHSTYAVALGDVDADGDLDVVAGNSNQANRLYLNNGTADPFNGITGLDITTDSYYTNAVALGDMDGDGDLDVVAGNSGQANRLYLNNGTADPFSGVTGSDITADADDTADIALGDVDGDGDLDVVAGNTTYHVNRLYLNNPFSGVTGSDIPTDANDTRAVALGDMDGDGDLDVVAGNNGQTNRLYLNNGTADPFGGVTSLDITADSDNTRSIAIGDMDNDGDLDVVAGNYGQANRLYLNNGTADPFSGVTGSDITADADNTRSVAIGDIDNDGDLDVAVGNAAGQANRLYLNNGTADPFSGVTGSDITADTDNTRSIALGDVNGDGDLDVVAGNYGVNRQYLNNGTADPFSGVTGSDITADADNTRSITLGDVDGDGDLDVVTGNWNEANRLYLNNGTADPFSGVTGSDITADADDTADIALGDVDGDGDLDVVAGNYGQKNRVYLNNGSADPFNRVTGSDISAGAYSTRAIALGNVDDDGDLDVVAGNYGVNRLYLNNGTAVSFSGVTDSDITADSHDSRAIALGDVDDDGDLDVVAGNYGTNRLYLNNGTADPFNGVTGLDITTDSYYTNAIALGDVDADGDLDVVAGNSGQANRLYLNNGTADPFSGVTGLDITVDSYYTKAIALGDVDADGDLDVVAGNYGTNRLYLNNGTADPFNGVTGSDITVDSHDTRAIALGDVDADGDLDVVAGNSNQVNRLYLNNGTADPFSGVTGSDITADSHDTPAIALGDVDADGDIDVVAGNRGQANRLYLNNGTADPFNGITGSDITTDLHDTRAIALGDVDADGDLDAIAGNAGTNRLYLNNGTADPFNGITGLDITADSQTTNAIALADVDGDGDLDVVAGNYYQENHLYQVGQLHNTGHGKVQSLAVATVEINNAILTPAFSTPPNTGIQWYLTNNGGGKWFIVTPGETFIFPTFGNDLRWKAELYSLSPFVTPEITEVAIDLVADLDEDGYDSYAAGGTDCDDNDPDTNIAATEVCDGIDNDCDKLIDDADPDLPQRTWYADSDSDTYGDGMTSILSDCPVAGYVLDNTDCDDTDSGTNPGEAEICDFADNDCDGYLNNGVADCFMVSHLAEGFEYGTPVNWTITDNTGTSVVWSFTDPGSRGNLTGGTGSFAIADSDYYGLVHMDTELRTPVMDMSGYIEVNLEFFTDFLYAVGNGAEKADVDVSVNGASGPWTNVWHMEGADYPGPVIESVDISSIAGGESEVMVRFRYYDAYFDWWWQVDDVQIFGRSGGSCAPPVWIAGYLYYQNFQPAYDEAVDYDTIMSQDATLDGSIIFDLNKEVTIEAGSNCDFTLITGTTTVNGDVAITDGKIIILDGTLAIQ